MSLYGYERQTTPNIARFAEQALVYHNHHAAGNYTPPGTASLLTGTYPWTHRCLHTSGAIRSEYLQRNVFALLPDEYHSLAYTHNSLAMSILFRLRQEISELLPFEILSLQENNLSGSWLYKDYLLADWSETIVRGVGHPPTSLFLSLLDPLRHHPDNNLVKTYSEDFPIGIPSANVFSRYFILEDAINWLVENLKELPTPYLTYFHLMPPHEPYNPRSEFVDIFLDQHKFPFKSEHPFSEGIATDELWGLRRQYDEYLAYADAEFGRLYESLSNAGHLENCYLILTSDHGQMFERGIHGHLTPTLYEPLLNIPLLIAQPGQTKRQDIMSLTSAVDVLPTLLSLIGEPVPDWIEGKILPGLGGDADNGRSVFALNSKEATLQGALPDYSAAIMQDNYKLIYYAGYSKLKDTYELYDLRNDPEELNDLYIKLPEIGRRLQNELQTSLNSP
jgi:arylsulfatase A-like enzyme